MIDRVKISKEFPGLWVGMEATVGMGDSPEQVLSDLYERVNEWQKWTKVNEITEALPVIQIQDDKTREEILKNVHKNKY